jgi:hypothetical protein
MPRKWQIFKIVTIFQFSITSLVVALALISFVKMYGRNDNDEGAIGGVIVGTLIFIVLLIYYSFCLQMIIKFYPDNEMPNSYKLFFSIIYIFAAIFSVIVAILFFILVNDLVGGSIKQKLDNVEIGLLIFFFVYATANLYTLFYSIKLRNIIKINVEVKQQNIIESLGKRNVDYL